MLNCVDTSVCKFVEYRKLKNDIVSKFKMHDIEESDIKNLFDIKHLRYSSLYHDSINFTIGKKLKLKYQKDNCYFHKLLKSYLIELCRLLEIDFEFTEDNSDIIFCIFEIYVDENSLNIVLY